MTDKHYYRKPTKTDKFSEVATGVIALSDHDNNTRNYNHNSKF